jgi:CheY-like chemotaxis protein
MTFKLILLINSEPTMGELMQLCLSNLGGWQVHSTSSPVEGLQRAIEAQPNAIVLDLLNSAIDYVSFLQKLRANPATANTPVVVLVANARWFNLKSLHPFQIAGIIDCFSDPVHITQEVAKLLNWDEVNLPDLS